MLRLVPTSLGPIAVRVFGGSEAASPPWILLHGASGSWRTFNEMLNELASRTDPRGDIVVIDLPGWGDSPGTLPFTIEEQGRAVTEALEYLAYRRWRICGHSMGGVLALEIASAEPLATLAVVALSPTALSAAAALRKPLQHPAMAPLVGMHLLMRFLHTTGSASPKLLRFAERTGLLRLALAPFFAKPAKLRGDVFADLAQDVRPASFLAAAQALLKYDVGRWHSISSPTLLARGEKDIFTPGQELEALAGLIPDAKTIVLPGTGHFAHLEDAPTLIDMLRSSEAPEALNSTD